MPDKSQFRKATTPHDTLTPITIVRREVVGEIKFDANSDQTMIGAALDLVSREIDRTIEMLAPVLAPGARYEFQHDGNRIVVELNPSDA